MIRDYLFECDHYEGIDITGHNVTVSSDSIPLSVLDIVKGLRPQLIIELGSSTGKSTVYMANHLKNKKIDGQIISINMWINEENLKINNGEPDAYVNFLKNIIYYGHKDLVIPIRTNFLIASRKIKRLSIKPKLIYFNHQNIKKELNLYWPLLCDTGVMIGGGYPYIENVRNDIDEFLDILNCPFEFHENDGGWVIHKTSVAKTLYC